MNWIVLGYITVGLGIMAVVVVFMLLASFALHTLIDHFESVRNKNILSDVTCFLDNIKMSLPDGYVREEFLLGAVIDELETGSLISEDAVIDALKAQYPHKSK